jgi:hypothetical protein
MPGTGCSIWPREHKIVRIATVTVVDTLSRLMPGSLIVTGASSEPSDPRDPDVVVTRAAPVSSWKCEPTGWVMAPAGFTHRSHVRLTPRAGLRGKRRPQTKAAAKGSNFR